jgi:hypothetical protein
LVFILLELLGEDGVLARKVVGERQIIVASSLLGFTFTFDRFFVAFDILREEILATNFVEVPEVVDSFVRVKPDFIKGVIDELLLTPVDVPVVIFCLAIGASSQGFLNTVGKVGLELDFGTRLGSSTREPDSVPS